MYDQDSGAPINPPPGYSSKTAYSFPLEQVEAIIRISACPRKDMAAKVITLPRRRRAKTSKRFKFRGPTATLGELEKLPVELLNEVCMNMSILSLSRFGQVNLRARQLVNSLREYRIATLHSLDVLEALATTRTASHITMSDYHRLLCERNYHLCGDYGNYVHLLNWIRCSWRCLAGLPPRRRMREDRIPAALQVTIASAAEHILNPLPTTFNKIPQLSSLPARYGLYQVQRKGRKDLVSVQSVIAALESDDAKVEELRRRLDTAGEARMLACMSCFPIPSYDEKSGTVQQGVAFTGCRMANNQLRILSGVRRHRNCGSRARMERKSPRCTGTCRNGAGRWTGSGLVRNGLLRGSALMLHYFPLS